MPAEKITNNVPVENGLWEHKEKGTAYMIVAASNLDAMNPEFVPTVTYRDVETKKLWSRPLHVFLQKFRFVGFPIMKSPNSEILKVLHDPGVVFSHMDAADMITTDTAAVAKVLKSIIKIVGRPS